MRGFLALAFVGCILAMLGAQSQPPSPGATKAGQAPQQKADGQDTAPKAVPPPIVPPSGEVKTQGPAKGAEPQQPESPDRWWEWFTESGANWVIAVLTGALIGIGGAQWWTARIANKHFRVVERAYVAISHHPPGLTFESSGQPKIRFAIKNHGRTPATIKNASFTLRTDHPPLPLKPIYGADSEIIEAFVMPDDSINVDGDFKPLNAPTIAAIHDGSITAWVLAFVDYEDRFGQRHRGGYARRYVPTQNLVMETTGGYNYDNDLKDES